MHTSTAEEERDAATQWLLSCLKWAAKRLGSVTSSLCLFLHQYEGTNISESGKPLINAFSGATCLDTLRCFTLKAVYKVPAAEMFCNWLLKHAAGLEACSLWVRSSYLEAGNVTMHRLRHLDLVAPLNESAFLFGKFCATRQFPVLETFCIHGRSSTELDVLDVAGCSHLRRLALYGVITKQLLKPDLCQVTFDPQDLSPTVFGDWPTQMGPLLGVLAHVILGEGYYSTQRVVGSFEAFPCMEMLVLKWPQQSRSEPDNSDEDDWNQEAASFLTDSMSDGRPLVNLKALIVWSNARMNVCIPGKLPSLEELVIKAYLPIELKFREPVAAFSGLKTSYAVGKLITLDGLDMIRVTSDALMARGLTLTAVSKEDGGKSFSEHSRTCIYMRPNMHASCP